MGTTGSNNNSNNNNSPNRARNSSISQQQQQQQRQQHSHGSNTNNPRSHTGAAVSASTTSNNNQSGGSNNNNNGVEGSSTGRTAASHGGENDHTIVTVDNGSHTIQSNRQAGSNASGNGTATSSTSNPNRNSLSQMFVNRLSLSPAGRRLHSGSSSAPMAAAAAAGASSAVGNANNGTTANTSGTMSGATIVGEEKSESSLSGHSDDASEKAALWCYLKAKTRIHDSTKVMRRTMWFEAKEGSSLKIGRAEDCDMRLDDDRCVALNASLLGVVGDKRHITLHPEARVYRLIGMGLKRGSISAALSINSVIKLGSVSLQVTGMCMDEAVNMYERFGAEIKQANNERRAQSKSADRKSTKSERKKAHSTHTRDTSAPPALGGASTIGNGESAGNASASGQGIEKTSTVSSMDQNHSELMDGDELPSDRDDEDEDDVDGDDTNNKPLHLLPDVTDPRDEMCYICWGGPSEEDLRGDLTNPNPLIRNPCGKCSGSSRYVHLECILRWINTNQSGHCSVCNGALPSHFSSPPPNLELKVVRHRRGQQWVGTRRFRLSFANKSHIVIGRDHECDVKLHDRSVCGTHSRIIFDKDKREFFLQDCASLSGTFLQVSEDMNLESGSTNYLKIGRTILSLRVTERRRSLRDFLPRISRALSR